MDHSRTERRKRKRRRIRRIQRLLILVGLLSFICLGGGATYFAFKVADVTSGATQELDRGEKSEKRVEKVSPSKDNISVLFLGVDDRDQQLAGRTDALVLATFNKENNSVKMVSIPRDSRVEIIGKSRKDKINHAHSYGGLDMTIATVEYMFDLPVDYYVKLNFQAFTEIIDSLGGIDVDVKMSFTEMDSNDKYRAITLEKGQQTLNGEEALAYARMRKADPLGDVGRGQRQQEIIAAVIKKSASLSSVTKFDDVLDSISTHLSTNLSFGNLLSLHSYAKNIHDIESLTLEGKHSRINGVYYYSLDEENVDEISETLRMHLGLD